MADYKIVDAGQLDTDLTAVADAIRERAGTAEKLSFPEGMAEAVKSISSGAALPELSNPGTAGDLAEGRQLIDANGNVVSGTIPPAYDMYADIEEENVWENNGRLYAYWPYSGDKAIMQSPQTEVISVIPLSVLGNAQPGDVAKGKIFTSSAGVKAEGTMEAPSGGVDVSIDGETLVFSGTASIENDTLIL